MKTAILGFLMLGMVASLQGETPAASTTTEFTPEQVDKLVGPIALYPDPLVALILPASTAPTDIVLAARYLRANGDPAQITNQFWDDSVKALANYPEIIEWMSDNLEWTEAMGRAFLAQPVQVMESIQKLRALAKANGTLVNTPQQNVITDNGNIIIEPVGNDGIVIPEYNPDQVFVAPPVVYSTTIIYYSPAQRTGPWLSYECDWDDYNIWRGQWHPGAGYDRQWRQPQVANSTQGFWKPDLTHQREALQSLARPAGTPPTPQPMERAPNRLPDYAQGVRPDRPDIPPHDGRDGGSQGQNNAPPQYLGRGSSPSLHPAPVQIGNVQQLPSLQPKPLSPSPNLSPQPLNPQPLNPPAIKPRFIFGPPNLHLQPVLPPPISSPPPLHIQQISHPPALTPRPLSPSPNLAPQPLTPSKLSTPPVSAAPVGEPAPGRDPHNLGDRGDAGHGSPGPPPVSRPENRPEARPETRPAVAPPPASTGNSSSATGQH